MSKILLLGSGGHCKSVLDSVVSSKKYQEIGIISQTMAIGTLFFGYPVVGADADLSALHNKGFAYAHIGVGSIGDVCVRQNLFTALEAAGFTLPAIVDPTATIAMDVTIGKGVFVGKHAVVNAGSQIADGVILNTGCIIEHDCVVGAFSHISPGAVLCGDVHIGEAVHIGANATIIQGITVGDSVMVGAGSVVTKAVASCSKGYGVPFRRMK